MVALKTCPACDSQVSAQALACPKCGQPLVAGGTHEITGINALIVVVGILVTAVLWVVLPIQIGWLAGLGLGVLPTVGAFVYATLRHQKRQ